MSGFQMIQKVKRLEEELFALGFRWGYPKHGWGSSDEVDRISIFPRDDELPVYNREAALFTGTIHELDRWLQGVKWAREYDMLMKVADDARRSKKEQDLRNKNLIKMMKNEEIESKDEYK